MIRYETTLKERAGAVISIGVGTEVAKPHTQPLLRPSANGERWAVEEDFVWYMDENSRNSDVTFVPTGYVSDLASVPRALESVVPRVTAPAASVAHDYAYKTGIVYRFVKRESGKDYYLAIPVSRARIDKNFKLALIACGINRVRANLMYAGVRVGGWRHFKKAQPLNDYL